MLMLRYCNTVLQGADLLAHPLQPYQQTVPAVQQQAAAQQAPAAPAAPAAAGPPMMPSAARPANAGVLFEYHCVGVQNYTSRAPAPCRRRIVETSGRVLRAAAWHMADVSCAEDGMERALASSARTVSAVVLTAQSMAA